LLFVINMSGHSKWSTIKRQKGVKDQKRGQIFTKLSYAIATAVREGGGVTDPASNFRLRLAIEEAKNANMPKENIKRAIERSGNKQGDDIEEIIYEGFGPNGISIIVETLTDNKQRTIAEVKNALDKNGGNMGVSGSVLYLFEKKGLILVEKGGKSLDDIFLVAADQGAEDVEDAEDEVIIYTMPDKLALLREGLSSSGLSIREARLIWIPKNTVTISDKGEAEKVIKFIANLEDLDDVQRVYSNFEIDESIAGEFD
jgi:YebC/PmpR family DNA-binding regulatory protein